MKNSIELFTKLADIGVCQTGRRYMDSQTKNIDFLIKVWKRWPEYLYEHSGVAIETLRGYLTEEEKNVLFDNDIIFDSAGFEKIAENGSVFFVVGRSKGKILIPKWAVVRIYVFNDSEVEIICGDFSIVNIESLDNSKVNVSGGKVTVWQYDNSEVASPDANIKKREMKRGDVFNGEEVEKSSLSGEQMIL